MEQIVACSVFVGSLDIYILFLIFSLSCRQTVRQNESSYVIHHTPHIRIHNNDLSIQVFCIHITSYAQINWINRVIFWGFFYCALYVYYMYFLYFIIKLDKDEIVNWIECINMITYILKLMETNLAHSQSIDMIVPNWNSNVELIISCINVFFRFKWNWCLLSIL